MKHVTLTMAVILFSALAILAQESKPETKVDAQNSKIIISTKTGAKVAVYIDGKKYDEEILNLLDEKKILAVDVLKGESAMKKYNEPNVIVVTTKKNTEKIKIVDDTIRIDNHHLNLGKNKFAGDPVIYVDGILTSKDELQKISPEKIKSISVLKDENAKKMYNTSSGAILVTLMK